MTAVPFTESCSMLGVSAKTLRQWLKHSNLSLHQSPMDARVKCLPIEQLQQLAILHGRSIKPDVIPPPESQPAPLAPVQPEKPTHLQLRSQLPSPFSDQEDLAKSLSSLEATVTTLQQQLTQLALQLLNARDLQFAQCLSTQTARLSSLVELPARQPSVSVTDSPALPVPKEGSASPVQRRAHSRILSLVEYSANGTYVIISPPQGELFFTPDSQEWFDWLASLSSFRFVGQFGRFSALRETRHGQVTRRWIAKRSWHNYKYSYYLGTTDRLTLSHLEQAAVVLQSRTTSR